ncbi:hypothetical protein J7E93_28575 [Streptomyces sp. ISL-36]|uniref:hypothetical protein n=1 Tax=Streptomyces sp. ISL-36 TaxID=2819182 RepID=UPI001BE6A7B2|nr:hypothetical protein [Streptomyces sp. ISL-36]MBT2443978.1 hypothetical protein [Streptomyces sp. ISL-36]
MNLRMIGLGAAVVCATLLPLVALAGQAEGPVRGDDARTDAKTGAGAGAETETETDGGLLPGLGLREGEDTRTAAGAETPAGSPSPSSATEPSDRASHCGPELTSPDGIEAQTCVLTEGPDTWARTYYRNATGQRLDAVLTLMGPGGRTVQVRCSVTAQDEPGACETPRERARGAVSAYSAVAEFAGAGEGDSTPLLLRSGSNMVSTGGS